MLQRRMMLEGENELIKYGYFDIENPKNPESENYQVQVADFYVEVDTGLSDIPYEMICIYIDPKMTFSDGDSIFHGNAVANGNARGNISSMAGMTENVCFSDPAAVYLRFDAETGKLYLHTIQWRNIKCGKWMWIAIYEE